MSAFFYVHSPTNDEIKNMYGYKEKELMKWDSTEKDLIYHEQYYKLSKAYTASYLVIKTNLLINI